MSDEIDDFIRRAAERRRQQGQGQGQRRAGRPQQGQGQGKPAQRQRVPRPNVVDAEVVSAEVIDDVARQAGRSLENQAFDQRAAQLGEETAQADDRLEARLHQTFDHQLGRLQQTSAAGPQATARSATDVAASVTTAAGNEMLAFLVDALRSPQQVRQAIILSDILQRPEHRW